MSEQEEIQAEVQPIKKKPVKKSNGFLEFTKELVIAFAVMFVCTKFIIRPVMVIGSSMYPTLETNSYGLTNVLGRRTGKLERFDIAIINVKGEKYLVKRVIGLPGETISCEKNQIYINGNRMEEPFLNTEYAKSYHTFTEDFGPITLGEDEYFCLGDNRPNSLDSRSYGPFKEKDITSKGILILFPFKDFGVKAW